MKLTHVVLLLAATMVGCAGTQSKNIDGGQTDVAKNVPAEQTAKSTETEIAESRVEQTRNESQGSASSLINAIEQVAQKIADDLQRGDRIAIVAFESENAQLSNFIIEELTGALFDRRFEIADRQNLDFVYRELNFQMSGVVDDEQINAVGRFLGADMVIVGQFVSAGDTYRLRVSAIHVGRGARASVIRLDVDGDEETRRFINDITSKSLETTAAGYGENRGSGRMSAGAFIDRGIKYALKREYTSAINDFGMAQMLNPNLAAAFALRGRAILASMHHPSAVAEDFSFVAASRWHTADSETRETFKKAIDEYTEAIRLEPQNPKYYWERAGIYHRAGRGDSDIDIAMADYNMAIQLDSNFAQAYNDRAVFCYRMGRCDVDKKIADLEHALKLKPDYTDAHGHLIDAYYDRASLHERNGNYDSAIRDFEKVLQLGLSPNHTWRPADRLERVKAKKAERERSTR